MKEIEIELEWCFEFATSMYFDMVFCDGEECPNVIDFFEDPETFGDALDSGFVYLILPILHEVEEFEKECPGEYYKVNVLHQGKIWGTYSSDCIDW